MELLKEVDEHATALDRYHEEVSYWEKVSRKRNASAKRQAGAALAFLKYLHSYIENEAYWLSWSPRGAIEASRLLGIPLQRVARTTNPLESFNGRIKGRYFLPYQHSGRLPRIDIWILLLVTRVIPDFFQERQEKAALGNFYAGKRRLQVDSSAQAPSHDTGTYPPGSLNLSAITHHDLPPRFMPSHADQTIDKWFYDLENGLPDEDEEMAQLSEHESASEIALTSDSSSLLEPVENGNVDSPPAEQAVQPVQSCESPPCRYQRKRSLSVVSDSLEQSYSSPARPNPSKPPESPLFSPSSFSSGLVVNYDTTTSPRLLWTSNLPDSNSTSSSDSELNSSAMASILRDLDINTSAPPLLQQSLVEAPQPPRRLEHSNTIATELMMLQQNQDAVLNNLQKLLRLMPASSAHQIEYQFNTFVQTCTSLFNKPSTSSEKSQFPPLSTVLPIASTVGHTTQSTSTIENENVDPSLQSGNLGLVPFTRRRKELRKPSYGIR